ncbi:putative IAA-alanine resistance protein 1-like [Capsicum annuum]|nr:putative IAA-alanine resistance protein 1-like [Capsicum annuum]
MRLWRKVSGLLKDQNSVWIDSLLRRTTLWNPDIEAAVIKATSHDEFSMNMKNVDRIFRWLRLSSTNIKPLIWAISIRTEKMRSWVVAIKVLILMHGLYSTRLPCIQRIGRLTFDLSNFKDGHSRNYKMQGINVFIRSYFAFLDQKSPLSDSAIVPLVLEAMDCVMTEIFYVYSKIRLGIARVLSRINSVGKVKAIMALKIIKKAKFAADKEDDTDLDEVGATGAIIPPLLAPGGSLTS